MLSKNSSLPEESFLLKREICKKKID